RLKRSDAAMNERERAVKLDPANRRYAYVYAVALHSTGKVNAALAMLQKTLAAHPNDRDVLEALASFHKARGDGAAAKLYGDRLRAMDNQDVGYKR
ncbi:MAG TPA: tetratricopeptide repeat protein, partial [Candidatus Limnocylindria bacterium]|nr:tetratricopeptide repeat protein [Candidatus Limnocylindria bacterium]